MRLALFLCWIATLATLSGCASESSHLYKNTGVRSSDPQATGPRERFIPRSIVEGVGIGPVRINSSVADALRYLGPPDQVNRTKRPPIRVTYIYDRECIWFHWYDTGIDPKITAGIGAECDKWQTAAGLRVGSLIRNVVAHYPEHCILSGSDSIWVITKKGISFKAKDRNSAVNEIEVGTPFSNWPPGTC